MALLKPIATLTTDDLEMWPLWTYATDHEGDDDIDETYVRPVLADVVPTDADYSVYHVACDVFLASGRRLSGHVEVCNGETDGGPPSVVDHHGEGFPLEHPPHRRNRAAFDALFREPYEALFPVRWRLRLLIAGEEDFREGEFAGPWAGQARH